WSSAVSRRSSAAVPKLARKRTTVPTLSSTIRWRSPGVIREPLKLTPTIWPRATSAGSAGGGAGEGGRDAASAGGEGAGVAAWIGATAAVGLHAASPRPAAAAAIRPPRGRPRSRLTGAAVYLP